MTTAFQIGAFQFDAFQEDAITGTISATDALDTASINAALLVSGSISATDALDTATITAEIAVSGVISTEDLPDFAVISGANRVDGYILDTDALDTATITGSVAVSGAISTTDQADTADITSESLVDGSISATDALDTADITGSVVYPSITGDISTLDQADTANFVGETAASDTHDGFTADEIKRLKKIQKKLAIAEAQKIQQRLNKRQQRRLAIQAQVDPQKVAQLNETKVESREEVKSGKPPVDLNKLNAEIARLERQKAQLMLTVKLRSDLANAQMALAIHEAKIREQELDDETALLMLL